VVLGCAIALAVVPGQVCLEGIPSRLLLATSLALLGMYIATSVACMSDEVDASAGEGIIWWLMGAAHVAGWLAIGAATWRSSL
jgi:hypothetical protein